jgi:hypothetical protein
MDPRRFDEIAQRVSQGVSRRSLVSGSVGASLLAAFGMREAAVAKKGKKGKNNGKNKSKQKNNDKKRTICHCPNGDASKCHTISVGKKAADSHLKNHCDYPGECRDDVTDPCAAASECLAITEREGCVTTESDSKLTVSTECSTGYGAIAFGVPEGTTFGEIETIETSFDFSLGSCGAGTPRFCVVLKDKPECPCTQFPSSSGCGVDGASGETGDLTDNSDEWFNLCDPNAPVINSYQDALDLYTNEEIDYIFLVAESSHGPQTVTVEPCITLA